MSEKIPDEWKKVKLEKWQNFLRIAEKIKNYRIIELVQRSLYFLMIEGK